MKEMIYRFIRQVAIVHDYLLTLNDAFETRFGDKDLHFLVFGAFGALFFLACWLLFKRMRNHPGLLAWLFSFVAVLMLALCVEVGQYFTHTGSMEMADIAAGMVGFCAFSVVVGVLGAGIGAVRRWMGRK